MVYIPTKVYATPNHVLSAMMISCLLWQSRITLRVIMWLEVWAKLMTSWLEIQRSSLPNSNKLWLIFATGNRPNQERGTLPCSWRMWLEKLVKVRNKWPNWRLQSSRQLNLWSGYQMTSLRKSKKDPTKRKKNDMQSAIIVKRKSMANLIESLIVYD